MGTAQLVTDGSEVHQRVGILPQLPSVLEADGVNDKMGVDVFGITVGGHLHLMPGPCLHGELPCNVMGFLIADVLSGRKGLDILIEVDAADKSLTGLPVEGLVLYHAVAHDTSHGTDVLPGFFDVGHGCHGAPRLIR